MREMNWSKVIDSLEKSAEDARAEQQRKLKLGFSDSACEMEPVIWIFQRFADALRAGIEVTHRGPR